MELNKLPVYDISDNPTGCCPRFKPEGWDRQELHFKDKPFVKATTRSFFHIPINMAVFSPEHLKRLKMPVLRMWNSLSF